MRNHSFSGKVTIRTKLLSVFLTAVLIPIIIFGFFTVRSSNTALENEASETYTQMTKQIAMIFSEYISRVDQTTRMVDNTAAVPDSPNLKQTPPPWRSLSSGRVRRLSW